MTIDKRGDDEHKDLVFLGIEMIAKHIDSTASTNFPDLGWVAVNDENLVGPGRLALSNDFEHQG